MAAETARVFTEDTIESNRFVEHFRTPGAAAKLVSAYVGDDIVRQRSFVIDIADPQPGETILDVGCGPGFLCYDLAKTLEDKATHAFIAGALKALPAKTEAVAGEGPAVAAAAEDGRDASDGTPRAAVDIDGADPSASAVVTSAPRAPACTIIGVDIAESMLDLARERTVRWNRDSVEGLVGCNDAAAFDVTVEYRIGGATQLPCEDNSVDLITVTQVLEYVPDMPAALAEIQRVLKPGGRVVALDTDWATRTFHTTDELRAAQRRLLIASEEHFADAHLPARMPSLVLGAGMTMRDMISYPLIRYGSFAPGEWFDPEYSATRAAKAARERQAAGKLSAEEADALVAETESWIAQQRALSDAGTFCCIGSRTVTVFSKPGDSRT